MFFSDSKKQIIVQKYSAEFAELVRCHFYFSQQRINNLITQFEEEDGIKISDLRILVALAQDFVATYRLLNWNDDVRSEVEAIERNLVKN